jgi:hypothetical protein
VQTVRDRVFPGRPVGHREDHDRACSAMRGTAEWLVSGSPPINPPQWGYSRPGSGSDTVQPVDAHGHLGAPGGPAILRSVASTRPADRYTGTCAISAAQFGPCRGHIGSARVSSAVSRGRVRDRTSSSSSSSR